MRWEESVDLCRRFFYLQMKITCFDKQCKLDYNHIICFSIIKIDKFSISSRKQANTLNVSLARTAGSLLSAHMNILPPLPSSTNSLNFGSLVWPRDNFEKYLSDPFFRTNRVLLWHEFKCTVFNLYFLPLFVTALQKLSAPSFTSMVLFISTCMKKYLSLIWSQNEKFKSSNKWLNYVVMCLTKSKPKVTMWKTPVHLCSCFTDYH